MSQGTGNREQGAAEVVANILGVLAIVLLLVTVWCTWLIANVWAPGDGFRATSFLVAGGVTSLVVFVVAVFLVQEGPDV